jgi:LacI family transcriptional regulator
VSPRPTIRDVAAHAGVSVATVSRVMNGKQDVSPAARAKVQAAAAALGYAPDAAAVALAMQRALRVGVVLGDSSGHRDLSVLFFGKVLAEISRRLASAGYEALLLNSAASQQGASLLDPKLGHRIDAVILVGVDQDDPVIGDLAVARMPCVGLDVDCGWDGSATVGSDHAEGVRLALRHLYALGHRRVAHIAGGANTVAGARRLAAFRAETEVFGLELPDEYVRFGDFSSGSGYRETCALLALPTPPTGLVVASDLMALAALQAVWDFGLEPGEDVAVVGFDDLEAASLAHPPLTTIRQDRQALGSLAAARVIELIEHPESPSSTTLLPVELVVRASTGTSRPAG